MARGHENEKKKKKKNERERAKRRDFEFGAKDYLKLHLFYFILFLNLKFDFWKGK